MLPGALALVLLAQRFGQARSWLYAQSTSWAGQYPSCNGTSQSPIDIHTDKAVLGPASESLKYSYQALGAGLLKVVNDGHFVGLNGRFGVLELPDGRYDALQLRIQFPAEHKIDGKSYPGELQIVHQREDSSGNNGVAVISILLQTHGGDNPEAAFFAKLGFDEVSHLPAAGREVATKSPVDLNSFHKELSGKYFHYQGSLTNPPCFEGIHWYILEGAAPVSDAEVSAAQAIFDESVKRPPQPLNNRMVIEGNSELIAEFPHPTEKIDPATWSEHFPDCSGRFQSPIDIQPEHASSGHETQKLRWYYYKPQHSGNMVSDGLGLKAAGMLGAVWLPGGVYEAVYSRFVFPAEHLLAGKRSAGEVQIFHRQRKCEKDCLAIVSILLVLPTEKRPQGELESAFFKNLSVSPAHTADGKQKVFHTKGELDMHVFKDQLSGKYYHYIGSLTEPPCTEKVHWYILEEPGVISTEQLKSFQQLGLQAEKRPVQPLNDRKIVQSYASLPGEFKVEASSTQTTTTPKTTTAKATTLKTTMVMPTAGKPTTPPLRSRSRDTAKQHFEMFHNPQWAWSYEYPDAWTGLSLTCRGSSQSPIDVRTSSLDTTKRFQGLRFDYYAYEAVGERQIANDGRVLRVDTDFGTLSLPDGLYQVKHVVLHFPSEHQVDGKQAVGELQIIHQRQGSHGTDDMAIIGLLLESEDAAGRPCEGREREFLEHIGFGPGMELPQRGERVGSTGALDLKAFYHQLTGDYFHYLGSLTAPPCTEGVHWYVLKRTAVVTADMVRSFKQRFPDPQNNRPIQTLHDRKIVVSRIDIPNEYAFAAGSEWDGTASKLEEPPESTKKPTAIECPFNCHVPAHSDAEKIEWCCSHEGLLCPTTSTSITTTPPFNCDSAYSMWESLWTLEKKNWCCREVQRGCHPFNCDANRDRWKTVWSKEKALWCCQHVGYGCLATSTTHASKVMVEIAPTDAPLPTCDVDYEARDVKWSDNKTKQCCERERQGCDYQCVLEYPDAALNWSASLSSVCCGEVLRGCGKIGGKAFAGEGDGCDGTLQSPVDIVSTKKATDHPRTQLIWEYRTCRSVALRNTGYALQASGHLGRLRLPDGTYKAEHVEFHFPSEHTIDGRHAAGEMQIFHAREGHMAIVSLLLELPRHAGDAPRDDPGQTEFFGNLSWRHREHLPGKEQQRLNASIDLSVFRTQLSGDYYHYIGSLTSPPCTQMVHWYLLREPAVVALKSILGFTRLYNGTNYRRTQALNGRTVVVSEVALPHEFRRLDWSYEDSEKWSTSYQKCAGTQQSPIAIDTARVIAATAVEPLNFTHRLAVSTTLFNTGQELVADGQFGTLSLGESGVYNAVQLRFHFPAEHSVTGKPSVGELQVVYEKLIGDKVDRVMVGLLFKAGQPEKGARTFFVNLGFGGDWSLPDSNGASKPKDAVDLGVFEGLLSGPYYHYKGSLTIPPCAQHVRWYIMQGFAVVSDDIVHSFERLFPGGHTKRPEQPLNGRIVQDSRLSSQARYDCISGWRNWEDGWSDEKKEWCCKYRQGGCDPFRCEDAEHWHAWSPRKKSWCCKYKKAGCPRGDNDIILAHWNYSKSQAWATETNSPKCNGRMQSPVALDERKRTGILQHLTLHYGASSGCALLNTGTVLRLYGVLGRIGLPDGIYEVRSVDFHFPAEHQLQGVNAVGELQIVHQKIGSRKNKDLAIVALLLELQPASGHSPTWPFFNSMGLGSSFSLPAAGRMRTLENPVDLNIFQQQLNGRFYHYMGSITTPPCTEGVHWYLLTEPAQVEQAVVDSFKESFPDPANNRPLQGLNGREVVYSEVRLRDSCEYRDPDDCHKGGGIGGWVSGIFHMDNVFQRKFLRSHVRLHVHSPVQLCAVTLPCTLVLAALAVRAARRRRRRVYEAILAEQGLLSS